MGDNKITFKNIGVNDQMLYTKVDVLKATRVNNNFAFSFYQFDYQALALSISGQSGLSPDKILPMPVAKVVMDYPVFQQLLKELNNLNEKFEKEMEEKG